MTFTELLLFGDFTDLHLLNRPLTSTYNLPVKLLQDIFLLHRHSIDACREKG